MKKLPILQTLFGILIFAQVEDGLAQGAYPPGTSLPPRGYVLPPPPAYRPSTAPRARVQEDQSAAKPVRKEVTTVKSTKPASSTSTKKKTSEVAKSSSKTPEKKSSSVAKSSKSEPKKSSVAKVEASKKPTDKSAVAATSSKRKDPAPEPKLVAATKSGAPAAKPIDKPANVDLGESPRDLHAPASSLTARNSVTEIPNQVRQSAVAPPVLPEETLEHSSFPNLTRAEKSVSGVVTTAEQLPKAVLESAAMMPLRFTSSSNRNLSAPVETPPDEPKGLAAADHAAAQTELDQLAAIAPRAAIVEPLPMVEFPPDADFEIKQEPEIGGAPVIAESNSATVEIPPPTEDVEPSKLLSTLKLETPNLVATPPEPRPSAPVKPTMTAVKTASFRAGDAPTDRIEPSERIERNERMERTEAPVDFPSEAKFSAPDTPPPTAPKPSVKISPGLGALSIDAERADSETAKNRVTFNGNVSMNCTRFTLKADKVIADMQGDDGSGSGVQKVVSEGHVVVNMNAPDGVGAGYVASGNKAVYDPEKETLLISGWPKIEEGNKALVASSAATEILIDTKTGRLTTTGSTKTMIK